MDLKAIMEIMSHKTPKMPTRYQYPSPIHKLRAGSLLTTPVAKRDKKAVMSPFGKALLKKFCSSFLHTLPIIPKRLFGEDLLIIFLTNNYKPC